MCSTRDVDSILTSEIQKRLAGLQASLIGPKNTANVTSLLSVYICLQVTTVDRYQGSQNDYVILSLVRTRHVGHLRDVRRLVVAMSRARLGLYVLARVSLFSKCRELIPAFTLVSSKLQPIIGHHYICCS